MFGIACKMVNDRDVAKDIVQEVFVYYYEKMTLRQTQCSEFQVQNLQSWLVRAAINKCIDHLNKKKKHISLIALNETATDEDKGFEIQQRNALLHQAIAELKPLEMKIVVLYSEEYSYKEIAEIAEIKFSSVGKTLSRTLSKLKIILKRLNYETY
jgi:RNA polymerase sigma-70 factor (ECF subfamily)